MWCELVTLWCVVAVGWAATARAPLQPKPEKFKDVEGCYVEDLDAVIPLGESAVSKTACLKYTCNETFLSQIGCLYLDAGPGAKVVEDKSKLYPYCCPRIEKGK